MTPSAASGPKRYTIGPGIVMMRQGERADRAWLIESGELEVLLTAADGSVRRLSVVGKGAVVGEMALIDDGERSATVRALTEVACVEVTRDAFRGLLKRSPPLASYLLQSLIAAIRRDYGLPPTERVGNAVDFRSTNSFQKVVDRRMIREGHVFFSPNDPVNAAYLIQSGRVVLRHGRGTLGEDIATVGPGSLFGEIYLLTGRLPDVTAVAVAGGICEVIDKRSFEEAVAAMPPILKSLTRIYITQVTKKAP
ncbi:cyclic nucleotide-binding domain-containing protein [Azospirillum sp. YIM B02556]|uniref:Cyclic nucleotide-binding domain-containing protein n=1 Tax=Azospirillum endophyticum TaxID=2800326 RepID=A0ABS1FFF2_9PROT|nr:cyclic nucleotide-binding domain-containing protein [Azospirillum endophyticum]MBK1842129.1 cyclic nucleotide-binding domain-containing protein [Azospirillum endophyticum]